ncbi:zinc ribbon domain-containing protein [Thermofilum sp.]|uniref:zinc ribbon domain-containing protein n=1 Tax=Thermofilum sp. TaxID=1961369 RepID=UPI00338D5A0B
MFSRPPQDTYAIYAPSMEELEQILKDILNQLQREARREYDENIRLVDSPIPREKFMEEFLENLNNYFIPPLNKHPVLTRKTIMRQEGGKGQPVYIEKEGNMHINHCPRCCAPVEPRARYCWRCGAKLK